MTKQMLIDAANNEEIRIVVEENGRVKEFEVETAGKAQVKGNIYVAEITRVEPSLQAAFIDYGNNRNGFLAFGEIHPEYFNLPADEKKALLEEMEELAKARAQQYGDHDDEDDGLDAPTVAADEADDDEILEENEEETRNDDRTPEEIAEDARALAIANAMAVNADPIENPKGSKRPKRHTKKDDAPARPARHKRASASAEGTSADTATSADGTEPKKAKDTDNSQKRERKVPIHRRYAIEDVVKEKQKILIQIVKEERGTKGAALTTYISLPGRYTVLMPNSPYSGGISRKINDPEDRRNLREIFRNVTVPNEMGWIVRTAGVGHSEEDIRADVTNLLNLWQKIKKDMETNDLPACLYEDGSLIVRALRDIYTDDVDDILISGRNAYRTAKDFAKALMPEIAKKIREHRAQSPIFTHYNIESALNGLYSPRVDLESGGYLIINPTEALVSIDINSGRATQEKNIEETAYKTNLEAADEIARQLRLRDLSGLVVIDFIDMEDRRNERNVERAMRKALRRDRARTQVGSISNFGLMELSRQRLRPSFHENTTVSCSHCFGTGIVPSVQTAALMILRNLEEENNSAKADRVIITTTTELAVYILNHKKEYIRDLESRCKFQILIRVDDKYISPNHRLELIRVQANGSERSETREISLRTAVENEQNDRGRGRKRNNRNSNRRDDERSGRGNSVNRDRTDKQEQSRFSDKTESSVDEKTAKDKAAQPSDKTPVKDDDAPKGRRIRRTPNSRRGGPRTRASENAEAKSTPATEAVAPAKQASSTKEGNQAAVAGKSEEKFPQAPAEKPAAAKVRRWWSRSDDTADAS